MITASVCCVASHQKESAARVVEGLKRHGVKIIEPFQRADIAIVWGVRSKTYAANGRHALVMERAYLGDRMRWTSLGWDGLNGAANFCNADVPADRWFRYWRDGLCELNDTGQEVLIIGQVVGDASLSGADVRGWAYNVAQELGRQGVPWAYRAHPKAIEKRQVQPLPVDTRPLEEAMRACRRVVTYTSNVGVLAAMTGKRVTCEDRISMVHGIAGHGWQDDRPLGDREDWGRKMGYTQWLPDEIEKGEFWPTLSRIFG